MSHTSNLQALVEAVYRAGKLLLGTSPRKHRRDGTVYTKADLKTRKAKNRRQEAARKEARKLNRRPKKRRRR